MNCEFITDKVEVLDKWENEKDGKIYYNIKVGGSHWNTNWGVDYELYDTVEVGESYKFIGCIGGFANKKWWKIKEVVLGK